MLKHRAYQAVLSEHSFTKSNLTRAEKLDKNYSKFALQPYIDQKIEVMHPMYVRNKRNQARFEKSREEMFDLMKKNLEKLELACTREIENHEIEKVLHIFSANRPNSPEAGDEKDRKAIGNQTGEKPIAGKESLIMDGKGKEYFDPSHEIQKSEPSMNSEGMMHPNTSGLKNEMLDTGNVHPSSAYSKTVLTQESKQKRNSEKLPRQWSSQETDMKPSSETKGRMKRKTSDKIAMEQESLPQIPIIRENSEQIFVSDEEISNSC